MSKYYAIESDVPLEEIVWGAAQQAPFEEMKVGDSFLIPPEQVGAVRNAASRYGSQMRKTFAVRKTTAGDHRCWRIK